MMAKKDDKATAKASRPDSTATSRAVGSGVAPSKGKPTASDGKRRQATATPSTAKAKQPAAKPPRPKKEKPLTRVMTAPIVRTGRTGDDYALQLARRVDIDALLNPDKSKAGRPLKMTPHELWQRFVEYCEWIANKPSETEHAFSSGIIAIKNSERPMSLRSFSIFAGIDRSTFSEYEQRPEFSRIAAHIRDIIFEQKFNGAARGEFDSALIARELDIGDRLDVAGQFDPTKPIQILFGKGNINAPKKTK